MKENKQKKAVKLNLEKKTMKLQKKEAKRMKREMKKQKKLEKKSVRLGKRSGKLFVKWVKSLKKLDVVSLAAMNIFLDKKKLKTTVTNQWINTQLKSAKKVKTKKVA